jgi:hypothetical protein
MTLDALPLEPDLELDDEFEPELAWLVAWAVAVAGPLDPEPAAGEASAVALAAGAEAGAEASTVVPVDVVPAGDVVVVVPEVVVDDDWAMAGPAPRNTRTVHSPAPTKVLRSDELVRAALAAVLARGRAGVVRGAT